jgi:hypothetical protein
MLPSSSLRYPPSNFLVEGTGPPKEDSTVRSSQTIGTIRSLTPIPNPILDRSLGSTNLELTELIGKRINDGVDVTSLAREAGASGLSPPSCDYSKQPDHSSGSSLFTPPF